MISMPAMVIAADQNDLQLLVIPFVPFLMRKFDSRLTVLGVFRGAKLGYPAGFDAGKGT
jgi:hypothetical protein